MWLRFQMCTLQKQPGDWCFEYSSKQGKTRGPHWRQVNIGSANSASVDEALRRLMASLDHSVLISLVYLNLSETMLEKGGDIHVERFDFKLNYEVQSGINDNVHTTGVHFTNPSYLAIQNSIQISFCHLPNFDELIAANICTRHDSPAVVSCANICSHIIAMSE